MGRPPAYIFVVRHGLRLDAADRQWHLTSPTPYDPPLTYGGWLHSQTVGARIASILRDREAEDEAAATADAASSRTEHNQTPTKPKRKRRYRVILHSSPFLRCVQTSVAISAGLSSNPPPSASSATETSHPHIVPARSVHSSSFSNPTSSRTRPTITTSMNSAEPVAGANQHIEKTVLRLDPFLGEWLSPGYFECITPPPKSALMLATAKAELLRVENYNEYAHFQTRHVPAVSTRLWSGSPTRASPLSTSMTPETAHASALDTLPYLGSTLPGQDGRSSGTSYHAVGHKRSISQGYTSPVPTYGISSSQPIPQGYVAHARDACVDIDYQWDSTTDQFRWGDGGELPEDWAAMHQRFRRGLKRLIDWYITTEDPGEMVTKTPTSPVSSRSKSWNTKGNERDSCAVEDNDDEEQETEDVVVLVSHGAGCHALIGAITHQAVYNDVPMSSLTMAIRRPGFDESESISRTHTASSLDDVLPTISTSVSEIYDVKLEANVDHLQAAIPPSALGRLSVGAGNAANHGRHSSAYGSALKEINFGAAYGGPVVGGGDHRSAFGNAALGSMRRASGGPSSVPRASIAPYSLTFEGGLLADGGSGSDLPSPRSSHSMSFGLWSPKPNHERILEQKADSGHNPEPPMLLDFGHERQKDKKTEEQRAVASTETKNWEHNDDNSVFTFPSLSEIGKDENTEPHPEEHDKFDGDRVMRLWAGTGDGGLWGAPRPPGEAERLRDFSSSKRRWTVSER